MNDRKPLMVFDEAKAVDQHFWKAIDKLATKIGRHRVITARKAIQDFVKAAPYGTKSPE